MEVSRNQADWRGAVVIEKFVSFCERKLWEGFPLQPSAGLRYLQSRGIDDAQLLKQRRIGYCPVGAENAFINELLSTYPELKDPLQAISQSGLMDSSKHLAFAGRIVFPLSDEERSIHALYGRAIRKDSERPHLYSHPTYQGLYNLDKVRNENKTPLDNHTPLIVTESILDALSLIQAGYSQVISLCGVRKYSYGSEFSLQMPTAKQLLCVGKEQPLVFMFDNDTRQEQVGHRCALNIMNQLSSLAGFQECEIDTRLAILPDNSDINELWMCCVSSGPAGSAEFRTITEECIEESIGIQVLRVRLAIYEMHLDEPTTRKLLEIVQNELWKPKAA